LPKKNNKKKTITPKIRSHKKKKKNKKTIKTNKKTIKNPINLRYAPKYNSNRSKI
jgi:hypothetical protein